MKKNFKNLFYLTIAGVIFLTSCNPEEGETPVPSLNIVNATSIPTEVNQSEEISFPLEVVALEKIEKISIMEYKNGEGIDVTGFPKTSGFKSNTEDNFTYKYTVIATEGTVRLVFSVTDKRGKTTSKEHNLTIKTAPVTTPMTEFKTGAIVNNNAGGQPGAYNLITGTSVSSSDAARHIEDAGIDIGLTSTTNWKKQWKGINGTEFVMISGDALTYENATKEAVTEAYTAGTKVTTTPALAVGNLLIAKAGTDYYFLQIIAVTNTSNDNLDKIEFKYKK